MNEKSLQQSNEAETDQRKKRIKGNFKTKYE